MSSGGNRSPLSTKSSKPEEFKDMEVGRKLFCNWATYRNTERWHSCLIPSVPIVFCSNRGTALLSVIGFNHIAYPVGQPSNF